MTKEYIERAALLGMVQPDDPSDETAAITIATAKKLIRSLAYRCPAADVAPVVHGRWIASHDEFCACSICKYPVYVGWNQTNYCPNCGAKMDGGDGNSDMA